MYVHHKKAAEDKKVSYAKVPEYAQRISRYWRVMRNPDMANDDHRSSNPAPGFDPVEPVVIGSERFQRDPLRLSGAYGSMIVEIDRGSIERT